MVRRNREKGFKVDGFKLNKDMDCNWFSNREMDECQTRHRHTSKGLQERRPLADSLHSCSNVLMILW